MLVVPRLSVGLCPLDRRLLTMATERSQHAVAELSDASPRIEGVETVAGLATAPPEVATVRVNCG